MSKKIFTKENKFVSDKISKKKRKKSKISAYTRNRNRIMQQYRRMYKKYGMEVTPLYIPTEKELKAQGITGHKLQSRTYGLKKISAKDISYFVNEEAMRKNIDVTTGLPFQNETGFEVPFTPSGESLVDLESIEFFDYFVNSLPEKEGTILLRRWKDKVVTDFGTHAFAQMFREANQNRPIGSEFQIYKGPVALNWINTAMYYLPDSGPITRDEYEQSMNDILEEMRSYESQGYWEELE